MYNNPYLTAYNPQANIDRINNQIAELEKMKSQLPPQPTAINQTFQLASNSQNGMRYANSIEEVSKEFIIGDTPFFSKEMSVVWIKNAKGDIKTYELNEIVPKDEKDIKIEFLQARIKELENERKIIDEQFDEYDDEPVEDEKPTSIQSTRKSKKK